MAGFMVNGTLRLVEVDACAWPACTRGDEGAVFPASAPARTAALTVADVEIPGIAVRAKLTVVAPVAKWVNWPFRVTVTFACPLFVAGETPVSRAREGGW